MSSIRVRYSFSPSPVPSSSIASSSPHPALLFSGGLDRQINVWDIHSPKPYAPIASLAVGGEADAGLANGGDKGSVYALVSSEPSPPDSPRKALKAVCDGRFPGNASGVRNTGTDYSSLGSPCAYCWCFRDAQRCGSAGGAYR